MALATRCPNCQAMFRVVSDQLKLRGGLVRCGSCRHVFDAIGSLSYIDDATLAAPAPPQVRSVPAAPAVATTNDPDAPAVASEVRSKERAAVAEPTTVARAKGSDAPRSLPEAVVARVLDTTVESSPAVESPTPADPLAVPTLLAPRANEQDEAPAQTDAPVEPPATAQSESLSEASSPVDTAEAEPATASTAASEDVAADAAFLRESQRPRGFSVIFGGGSTVLAVVLFLQLAMLFRTELITRWPQLRPSLVQLCDAFGCSVGWPTRAELLAVVGTELQAIPGTDMLELTAVVRNRASFTVALPAVEITLTDTNNRTLARKVFAPVDYLASNGEPSSRINEGLGAGSDYIVRITFEARGLNAAGFVVYPFYL